MSLAKILSLKRPLVLLDLETTGTSAVRDRIVQIGLIKIYPNGEEKPWDTLVNPGDGFHIPKEATDIHGITDEMVANSPKFEDVAGILSKGLSDSDIGGYNVSFDLRFLETAFKRIDYPFDIEQFHLVDGYKIFSYHHPRNLTAAVKQYLSETFEDAHDAAKDIENTKRVLEVQFQIHSEFPRDVEEIHKTLFENVSGNRLDSQGKIVWRDNIAVLNFGDYNKAPLQEVPRGYLKWMLKGNFSSKVKKIIEEALDGSYPERT